MVLENKIYMVMLNKRCGNINNTQTARHTQMYNQSARTETEQQILATSVNAQQALA
jgi:hypothetical protein